MAILSTIFCHKCNKQKQVGHGSGEFPSICGECAHKEEADKKAAAMAALESLSTEQRLRRIEEWIYNYRPYMEPRF